MLKEMVCLCLQFHAALEARGAAGSTTVMGSGRIMTVIIRYHKYYYNDSDCFVSMVKINNIHM